MWTLQGTLAMRSACGHKAEVTVALLNAAVEGRADIEISLPEVGH
jgi:hypothetical protein